MAIYASQPHLLRQPIAKDVVYTPDWVAQDMIDHFSPWGSFLDPCMGEGAFLKKVGFIGEKPQWCEISFGSDFYAFKGHVDWIISNPPYSDLLKWIRHSMNVADNIVYLMPLHRVFASNEFLDCLTLWGGIAEIRRYGTGTDLGFPFGHAVGAVYYKKDYGGETNWSRVTAPHQ